MGTGFACATWALPTIVAPRTTPGTMAIQRRFHLVVPSKCYARTASKGEVSALGPQDSAVMSPATLPPNCRCTGTVHRGAIGCELRFPSPPNSSLKDSACLLHLVVPRVRRGSCESARRWPPPHACFAPRATGAVGLGAVIHPISGRCSDRRFRWAHWRWPHTRERRGGASTPRPRSRPGRPAPQPDRTQSTGPGCGDWRPAGSPAC